MALSGKAHQYQNKARIDSCWNDKLLVHYLNFKDLNEHNAYRVKITIKIKLKKICLILSLKHIENYCGMHMHSVILRLILKHVSFVRPFAVVWIHEEVHTPSNCNV